MHSNTGYSANLVTEGITEFLEDMASPGELFSKNRTTSKPSD